VAKRRLLESEPRLAQLRRDVAIRLRPSCAHLSASAFAQLVESICALKLRWEDKGELQELEDR
jgi:hypothetical protein